MLQDITPRLHASCNPSPDQVYITQHPRYLGILAPDRGCIRAPSPSLTISGEDSRSSKSLELSFPTFRDRSSFHIIPLGRSPHEGRISRIPYWTVTIPSGHLDKTRGLHCSTRRTRPTPPPLERMGSIITGYYREEENKEGNNKEREGNV